MSFLLHVTSRMNSTWQGQVDWLDDSPNLDFDSALVILKELETKLSLLRDGGERNRDSLSPKASEVQ